MLTRRSIAGTTSTVKGRFEKFVHGLLLLLQVQRVSEQCSQLVLRCLVNTLLRKLLGLRDIAWLLACIPLLLYCCWNGVVL